MFLRALGKVFGIGGQYSRAPFNQQDVRSCGVDGAELMREGVTADFGESSGEFDSGGPGADDDEIQLCFRLSPRGLPLGQFEGEQDAATNFERIFDGLEAGSRRFPIIVSEVSMA